MSFYCINCLDFLVLTHSIATMIISAVKMAKCDVFETYSSGKLLTLIVSVIAPTILMKLSPHLSQMRNAGAVVGRGEEAEKALGRQVNVNPFMPVRRVNF